MTVLSPEAMIKISMSGVGYRPTSFFFHNKNTFYLIIKLSVTMNLIAELRTWDEGEPVTEEAALSLACCTQAVPV